MSGIKLIKVSLVCI